MAQRGRPKRLRADPELELELRVCHHYRLRHSEFLAWDQDDRDKAIWMLIRERSECPQCGTRPDEWDPAQGGNRRAYLAEVEVCRGCQTMSHRSEGLTDEQRGRGHQVVLKRNKGVADGEQA